MLGKEFQNINLPRLRNWLSQAQSIHTEHQRFNGLVFHQYAILVSKCESFIADPHLKDSISSPNTMPGDWSL